MAPSRTNVQEVPGSRQTLGVGFNSASSELKIAHLVPGSLDDRAGIRIGDVLLAVDGQAITMGEVAAIGRALEASRFFGVLVARDGEELSLEVPGPQSASPIESRASSKSWSESPEALLDRLVGSYDVEARIWPAADATPTEYKGTATFARSHRGKHMHESFLLEVQSGTIEGDAYLAWRPRRNRFELSQIDTFSSSTFWLTGAWDEERERLAFVSIPQGENQELRWEYRFEEDGVLVKEMFLPQSNGSFRLASDYRYIPSGE